MTLRAANYYNEQYFPERGSTFLIEIFVPRQKKSLITIPRKRDSRVLIHAHIPENIRHEFAILDPGRGRNVGTMKSVVNLSWHCGEKALAFPAAHSLAAPLSLSLLLSSCARIFLFLVWHTDTFVGGCVHKVNTHVHVECVRVRRRPRPDDTGTGTGTGTSERRVRVAQRTTLDCEARNTSRVVVDDGNV